MPHKNGVSQGITNSMPSHTQTGNTYTTSSPSPEEWQLIWTRKFRSSLYKQKKAGRGYTPIIKNLIAKFPGYPGKIKQGRLKDFICSQKETEKKKGIHTLRHSFATHLLEQGGRSALYSRIVRACKQ